MSEINASKVRIDESWKLLLKAEFEADYFFNIKKQLQILRQAGETIYPPGPLIFKTFDLTPVDILKVVILGQDPYHNPGEAMGMSFSVPKGIKTPPSLSNIYKELSKDVGTFIPSHGDLSKWGEQGVLMLNAILTVSHNKPASHRNIGWQLFTDAVIAKISSQLDGIVFLLWGNFAKSKADLIDHSKHLVLSSAHPSPLAGGAFFGNHHFSLTNKYLMEKGKNPIDWQIV